VPHCHNGLGAAITAVPGLVLAGASDGHLRIYAANDGNVLWDFDTQRAFPTVNDVTGRGGAIAGAAAPLVYRGQVYVGSGYGFSGKMPGNVLLGFSVR
jgi:polyvinyl alcohol dehydrogenase (cytochrome)